MDNKTFFTALFGGLVASFLGPALWSALGVVLDYLIAEMNTREWRRVQEKNTRIASAIVDQMRNHPGKKWYFHQPERLGRSEDREDDELSRKV